MKRQEKKVRAATRAPTDTHNVSALIGPIIGLLHGSGISKKEILAECRTAIRKAESKGYKLPVTHVEFGKDAIEIVNRWLRDPKYLNRHGRPDELPLTGPRSLTSLINDCRVNVPANRALAHLLKFKIATHVSSKQYRLVRTSMDFWHADHLPFEPNFRFLVDATRAATNRLQRPKYRHRLFWHCADNSNIPMRATEEFLNFAWQRGLSFMHEINDWLGEHEQRKTSVGKRRNFKTKRLGIGLFPIVSDN